MSSKFVFATQLGSTAIRAVTSAVVAAILCMSQSAFAQPWSLHPGYETEQVVGGTATFGFPVGLGVDNSGNVLVADFGASDSPTVGDGIVYSVDADGVVTPVSTGYINPIAVWMDASGTLYVADAGGGCGAQDGVIYKDTGSGPVLLEDDFICPGAIVQHPLDPSKILVSELVEALSPAPLNSVVYAVDTNTGARTVYWDGDLTGLGGIALNPVTQELVGNDIVTTNVHELASLDQQSPIFPDPFTGSPNGIAFDVDGNLYVVDAGGGSPGSIIYRHDFGTGELTPLAGSGATGFFAARRVLHHNGVVYWTQGFGLWSLVGKQFVRGDSNGDSAHDLGDAVSLLSLLFVSGSVLCEDAGDANDDGNLDISDPIFLLTYLFSGGVTIASPGLSCGPDPTFDALGCDQSDCP